MSMKQIKEITLMMQNCCTSTTLPPLVRHSDQYSDVTRSSVVCNSSGHRRFTARVIVPPRAFSYSADKSISSWLGLGYTSHWHDVARLETRLLRT